MTEWLHPDEVEDLIRDGAFDRAVGDRCQELYAMEKDDEYEGRAWYRCPSCNHVQRAGTEQRRTIRCRNCKVRFSATASVRLDPEEAPPWR